jgi:hypothetical protein
MGVGQGVVAEQGVHLHVAAFLAACQVAMSPERALQEAHHRTKWVVPQREALGVHSR